MRTGMAQRVREAAKKMGRPFCVREIKAAVGVKTYAEGASVFTVLRDMKRTGEMECCGGAVYSYKGIEKERTKLDVIWHLVRSHRQFSTDEIERLSGAARLTVIEYLQCLRRAWYIRQVRRGHWQMVNDPGPATPVNTAKCEKLKKMRSSKLKGEGKKEKNNHESAKHTKHERKTK